ncbi:VacJ family lipoprotein [Erythrobacter sp. YT30]|uniref:MlaA family lipoprotein n=1 Tax=Erythrobacter sp. YT30 TaxID=1735012 RepID=UPI0018D23F6D|nr:VacJ family lipoprotein [Erythrobacter sp. YT30]
MLDFRTVMAVSLALTAQAPLAAENAVDFTSELVAPQAAVLAVAQAKRPAPPVDTYSNLIAVNWSLTPGQAQEPTPQSGSEEGQQELEEEASETTPATDEDGNEIIVDGSYGPPENDPVEALNYESYRITQAVDDAVVEPVAYAYRDGLPGPFRDGLGNIVRNLGEPVNALNFLLQGKIGKTIETLTRLLINSTLGIGGLFDIAEKPGIGLPYRRNGFANTLGFYGVDSGAYLYLPFTGATSVRDVIGSGLDQLVLPVAVGAPFNTPEYTIPYFIVSSLDARLEVDAELARIDQTVDPYAARRDTYLARREREIALLRGEEPPEPPLILLEVEGVIEPGEERPSDEVIDEALDNKSPPAELDFERGEMSDDQIR